MLVTSNFASESIAEVIKFHSEVNNFAGEGNSFDWPIQNTMTATGHWKYILQCSPESYIYA